MQFLLLLFGSRTIKASAVTYALQRSRPPPILPTNTHSWASARVVPSPIGTVGRGMARRRDGRWRHEASSADHSSMIFEASDRVEGPCALLAVELVFPACRAHVRNSISTPDAMRAGPDVPAPACDIPELPSPLTQGICQTGSSVDSEKADEQWMCGLRVQGRGRAVKTTNRYASSTASIPQGVCWNRPISRPSDLGADKRGERRDQTTTSRHGER